METTTKQTETKTKEVMAIEQVFKQNDCLSLLQLNNLKRDLIICIYDLQIEAVSSALDKLIKNK